MEVRRGCSQGEVMMSLEVTWVLGDGLSGEVVEGKRGEGTW